MQEKSDIASCTCNFSSVMPKIKSKSDLDLSCTVLSKYIR